jgi:methanogenic corrinoid protein MtbC1
MWELRYGAPYSQKASSGHRRYLPDEVKRLHLVKLALASGQKPSRVVAMPTSQLKELISKPASDLMPTERLNFRIVEIFIEHIKKWDEIAFIEACEQEWSAIGPIGFVTDRVSPLLRKIGEDWADGMLPVASEHFASEVLLNFLTMKWRNLNEKNKGETIIVSALEGESHIFGLSMCSIVLVSAGFRVVYLGASTPNSDIIASAMECKARAICLSISSYYWEHLAEIKLNELQQKSPSTLKLIIGGEGAHKILALRYT